MLRSKIFVLSLLLCLFGSRAQADDWKSTVIKAAKNGGVLVEDENGHELLSHLSDQKFIPASILKVATSACAIDMLGRDFHFYTNFYLTSDHVLVMKGYGDPFLVSEEWAAIAKSLKRKGLENVNGILVDTTFFDKNVEVSGSSQSDNPYDAVNGAMIANFNTINILKKGQQISSAETQTPLTPTARRLGAKAANGKSRINLGKDSSVGAIYAGELLAEFLKNEGIKVSGEIKIGVKPEGVAEFYQHESSKTVADVVRNLLDYSTNFMANQLFLVMGAKKFGAPATLEKGASALTTCLENNVGWKNFKVVEGAGLSRDNRVTPREMIKLLKYFKPNADLLPLKEKYFYAKTGTLTGVNSLAGFFNSPSGKKFFFAIIINDAVPFDYKFRVAKMIYDGLH